MSPRRSSGPQQSDGPVDASVSSAEAAMNGVRHIRGLVVGTPRSTLAACAQPVNRAEPPSKASERLKSVSRSSRNRGTAEDDPQDRAVGGRCEIGRRAVRPGNQRNQGQAKPVPIRLGAGARRPIERLEHSLCLVG